MGLPLDLSSRELSFEEKLKNIQKYLPSGLTEKILSQKDRIEGERKQVTVMFADMEGFTSLSERLGIEEAYAIMDQVYEILIQKVHEYEGTVNEMTGDGIMALFGAPIALEDAPQKAIRSAVAIHREMASFSGRIRQSQQRIPPIRMRIGIHTGPVVVGTLGNDLRLEFKAVGDTVNVASRMESLAEPGTTYVSDETFQLTEGFFSFEALGEKVIKGKEKPVKIYRFIAPSSRRTRFDVSAERGLTRFVGRERELELLIDGFERSKSGYGQAVSVEAEAGVGKSRLIYEFRKAVGHEDLSFLEGKCLSYSRDIAYYPLSDILRSIFDIKADDGDPEIKNKACEVLKTLEVDEPATHPYVFELLSVKDSGINSISMSAEARKDRTIHALQRIVLKYAEARPLVMVIEDLHWIDKSSEESLRYLLESIAGVKVFLVFTYRPNFICDWGSQAYHSRISLNRLSNRESLVMAYHVLGAEKLDQNLEKLILTKTDGVPFFVEEFVKSLKDLKLVAPRDGIYCLIKDPQKMTIPSTIQDVIMARVDALPKGAKDVLQAGSVIERGFSYELIKRVTGIPEPGLLSFLSVLKELELLYERGIYPQSDYIFKHALTREVVYDSILKSRKKRLHDACGNAIEQLYPDTIETYYGVLAEHFIASENYPKGAEYARLAERKAEKSASLVDAITYAKKRVECLEKMPAALLVQEELIDARTALGLYAIQSGFHADAKAAVASIVDLAQRLRYRKRLSQIYTILGTYSYLVEENFPEAFKYLEEALAISQEMNDMVSTLFSNFWLAVVRAVNCEYGKALSQIEKALEINISAGSLWGVSIIKSNLSFFIYYFQGQVDLSLQASSEALRGANESGDIFSKAMASVCHGIACYGKGLFEAAAEHLSKGSELCEKIDLVIFQALGRFFRGESFFEIGEYAQAKTNYRKAIRILEENQIIPSWKNVCEVALARTRAINNEAGLDLEPVFALANLNKAKFWDGFLRRNIGEILMHIDASGPGEAESWINQAIEADQNNGVGLNLGRDYVLASEFYLRQEDPEQAKKSLQKAMQVFSDCGADGFLKRAEMKWASIS